MRLNTCLLAMVFTVAALLAGCAGGERLSVSMASINQEYGELQNEALLLNILRRSASLPAHFSSLTVIRGRSRITAGADLTVPFGADAPARFDFNPHLSIDQGPAFEVALQDNQEFYRAYVAPLSTITIRSYLGQGHSSELLLSLFIDRIRINRPNGEILATNSPDQPDKYKTFQRVLKRLVDQGLTMEGASLVNNFGTPLRMQQPPSLDQLLSVHKEGLEVQKAEAGHYQLMKLSEAARFCFTNPQEPLFEQARCSTGLGNRFTVTDPRFFGSTGGSRVVFSPSDMGSIEMYTRSLAELLGYLGEIVRAQQASKSPLMVRTETGPQPILVVLPEPQLGSAIVATEFAGTLYGIPAGPENGQSGTVLTIVSQLMAQAQSVKDRPISNTITIVGN